MCSTKNSQRRARYGYKPFLTSTFAFIYQFMIQNSKFEIRRQKYFVMAIAATNSLPHPPQFLSVFKISYQQLGTETSPVIGLKYLLLVGQIWWRSDRKQRNLFTTFSIIRPHGPIFIEAVRN